MVINYGKLFSTRYVCTHHNLNSQNWVRKIGKDFFLTFGRFRLRHVHTRLVLNILQINYIKNIKIENKLY